MSIHSHRTVYVSLSSRLTLLPRSPQPDSYMVPITDINVSDDGNAGEEWGLVLGDVTFDTATLAPLPGDTFATAGRTCSHLMAAGRPDGDYYIDPVGKGDFAQMAKVTCDMVGGGGEVQWLTMHGTDMDAVVAQACPRSGGEAPLCFNFPLTQSHAAPQRPSVTSDQRWLHSHQQLCQRSARPLLAHAWRDQRRRRALAQRKCQD